MMVMIVEKFYISSTDKKPFVSSLIYVLIRLMSEEAIKFVWRKAET